MTQSLSSDGQTPTIARIPFANGIGVVGGVEADDVATTTLEVTGLAILSGGLNLGGGKAVGQLYLAGATVTGVATLPIALSGYAAYRLQVTGIDPVTANAALQIQFSADGGSTWGTGSDYDYAGQALSSSVGATPFGGTGASSALVSSIGLSATAGFNHSADIRINSNISQNPISMWEAWLSDQAGVVYSVQGGGRRRVAANVDHVRLLFSSGNIATATYVLYGLAG